MSPDPNPPPEHREREQNRARSVPFGPIPILLLALAAILGAGCGKPNKANIELRKKNDTLLNELTLVKRQRDADRLTIEALQKQQGGGVESLPPTRLETLYTTHGLVLGRLTGGADLDPSKPGDEGLRVYAGLVDQSGQKFKAAGSFVVEAFDLGASSGQDTRLGQWTVDARQARDAWNGLLLQYGYILTLPWQQAPTNADVTLKVTFRDELTGRQFVQQKVVKVNPPGASANPQAPAAPSAGAR